MKWINSAFPRFASHDKVITCNVGTVIHIHKGGAAYEVEFPTLDGRTLAAATVPSHNLRPGSRLDVAHVRELQAA